MISRWRSQATGRTALRAHEAQYRVLRSSRRQTPARRIVRTDLVNRNRVGVLEQIDRIVRAEPDMVTPGVASAGRMQLGANEGRAALEAFEIRMPLTVAEVLELRSSPLPAAEVDPAHAIRSNTNGLYEVPLRNEEAFAGRGHGVQQRQRNAGLEPGNGVAQVRSLDQGLMDRLRKTIEKRGVERTRIAEASATRTPRPGRQRGRARAGVRSHEQRVATAKKRAIVRSQK